MILLVVLETIDAVPYSVPKANAFAQLLPALISGNADLCEGKPAGRRA
jgi:hypothetical protein